MATKFIPRQAGTTETSFQIGAGHGKKQFKLDATSFTNNHTWFLPDSEGDSNHNFLNTDGAGNLTWGVNITPNVIANSTIIPVDQSYFVVGYLTISNDFVVNGNVGVL